MDMKMMRLGGSFLVLAAMIIAGGSWAFADTTEIKTKVIDVNSSSNYLKVDHLNSNGEMEEIKMDVSRSTHFEVYTALSDIKVGDEVKIQADYNAFNHEWQALSIGPYDSASAQNFLEDNAQAEKPSPELQVVKITS